MQQDNDGEEREYVEVDENEDEIDACEKPQDRRRMLRSRRSWISEGGYS